MIEINGAVLSACLRENAADLLALVPAVRRSAEHDGCDTACIDALAKHAYQALRLSENLAAYTQLCEAPPKARPFCVSALITSFFADAGRVCRATFNTLLPQQPIFTYGDARLFTICLGNLVGNALSYTHQSPVLTLRCTLQHSTATLTLTDNGTGMQPPILARAFSPWFAHDPYCDGTTPDQTGLGLSIVQRYAAVYGGRFLLESEFGTGSSFTLALPCAAHGETTPAAAPQNDDLLTDCYSILHTQLCSVCKLPI